VRFIFIATHASIISRDNETITTNSFSFIILYKAIQNTLRCYSIHILKLSIHKVFMLKICIYKVLVYCLDPLYYRRFLLLYKRNRLFVFLLLSVRSVLCYEIFKKWPLLSLFTNCIWKKLPLFHLTIILEP